MSERTLKQLVGALVVVVAAWGVATFLSGGGGSIGASGDIVTFFDGLERASIERVRIEAPTGSTELVREGGVWRANDFESSPSAVDDLLGAIEGTEVGELSATNPANHARMGVSEDSAAVLEVEAGGDTRTLLVGDQGPRFGTMYARLPGEDAVYLLEGDLRVQLRRPAHDWRNKEIAVVDTAAVARVEIERDGEAYALVRGDSTWAFEDGGEADAAQVRNLMAELSTVLAAGFVTEADSLWALPEGASTVAYAADGSVLADLMLGDGEGDRWARAAGDSVTYRLSTFRAGRLAPTLEAMRGGS